MLSPYQLTLVVGVLIADGLEMQLLLCLLFYNHCRGGSCKPVSATYEEINTAWQQPCGAGASVPHRWAAAAAGSLASCPPDSSCHHSSGFLVHRVHLQPLALSGKEITSIIPIL